jgi:hypothetical protein
MLTHEWSIKYKPGKWNKTYLPRKPQPWRSTLLNTLVKHLPQGLICSRFPVRVWTFKQHYHQPGKWKTKVYKRRRAGKNLISCSVCSQTSVWKVVWELFIYHHQHYHGCRALRIDVTLYCYMFQSMEDHHWAGIKCKIFYKDCLYFTLWLFYTIHHVVMFCKLEI